MDRIQGYAGMRSAKLIPPPKPEYPVLKMYPGQIV